MANTPVWHVDLAKPILPENVLFVTDNVITTLGYNVNQCEALPAM